MGPDPKWDPGASPSPVCLRSGETQRGLERASAFKETRDRLTERVSRKTRQLWLDTYTVL